MSARLFLFLLLVNIIAMLVSAYPTITKDSFLDTGDINSFNMTRRAEKVPMQDDGLPDASPGTNPIKWGRQYPKGLMVNFRNDPAPIYLPSAHCFGGHSIANLFFDHAVAEFCYRTNGLILDMANEHNNSVAMTYRYWPPAMRGGKGHDDCGEVGQVYLQIGFGLGAPKYIKYTLSTKACVRGLQKIYNDDCDNTHVDWKRGGQLDLGRLTAHGNDPDYNDHLFYLADPNPPIPGRNRFCGNLERFVPNLENTEIIDEVVDICYDEHWGHGGDDYWDKDPPEWKDHDASKKAHKEAKKACSDAGGKYGEVE